MDPVRSPTDGPPASVSTRSVGRVDFKYLGCGRETIKLQSTALAFSRDLSGINCWIAFICTTGWPGVTRQSDNLFSRTGRYVTGRARACHSQKIKIISFFRVYAREWIMEYRIGGLRNPIIYYWKRQYCIRLECFALWWLCRVVRIRDKSKKGAFWHSDLLNGSDV